MSNKVLSSSNSTGLFNEFNEQLSFKITPVSIKMDMLVMIKIDESRWFVIA